MREHEKPNFEFLFDVENELGAIRAHRELDDRQIPVATEQNLLIATWNLTNFGLQDREGKHFALMAEILRPFDIVAVQEISDDLAHLEQLMRALGQSWGAIYTDIAGNKERLGYLFKKDRVEITGLTAELAMRGYERARIEIEGIDPLEQPFPGFNRNPFIVGFRSGGFNFGLVNVHLYWSNMGLRKMETEALAKWAKSRIGKPGPPHDDIILLGDFNMPRAGTGDAIFDILHHDYGMTIPKHATNLVGTNLAGDADYDEIAFFPSRTNEDFSGRIGVFDFDNALFKSLWDPSNSASKAKFFKYIRYYIADHRPFWAEFKRGDIN